MGPLGSVMSTLISDRDDMVYSTAGSEADSESSLALRRYLRPQVGAPRPSLLHTPASSVYLSDSSGEEGASSPWGATHLPSPSAPTFGVSGSPTKSSPEHRHQWAPTPTHHGSETSASASLAGNVTSPISSGDGGSTRALAHERGVVSPQVDFAARQQRRSKFSRSMSGMPLSPVSYDSSDPGLEGTSKLPQGTRPSPAGSVQNANRYIPILPTPTDFKRSEGEGVRQSRQNTQIQPSDALPRAASPSSMEAAAAAAVARGAQNPTPATLLGDNTVQADAVGSQQQAPPLSQPADIETRAFAPLSSRPHLMSHHTDSRSQQRMPGPPTRSEGAASGTWNGASSPDQTGFRAEQRIRDPQSPADNAAHGGGNVSRSPVRSWQGLPSPSGGPPSPLGSFAAQVAARAPSCPAAGSPPHSPPPTSSPMRPPVIPDNYPRMAPAPWGSIASEVASRAASRNARVAEETRRSAESAQSSVLGPLHLDPSGLMNKGQAPHTQQKPLQEISHLVTQQADSHTHVRHVNGALGRQRGDVFSQQQLAAEPDRPARSYEHDEAVVPHQSNFRQHAAISSSRINSPPWVLIPGAEAPGGSSPQMESPLNLLRSLFPKGVQSPTKQPEPTEAPVAKLPHAGLRGADPNSAALMQSQDGAPCSGGVVGDSASPAYTSVRSSASNVLSQDGAPREGGASSPDWRLSSQSHDTGSPADVPMRARGHYADGTPPVRSDPDVGYAGLFRARNANAVGSETTGLPGSMLPVHASLDLQRGTTRTDQAYHAGRALLAGSSASQHPHRTPEVATGLTNSGVPQSMCPQEVAMPSPMTSAQASGPSHPSLHVPQVLSQMTRAGVASPGSQQMTGSQGAGPSRPSLHVPQTFSQMTASVVAPPVSPQMTGSQGSGPSQRLLSLIAQNSAASQRMYGSRVTNDDASSGGSGEAQGWYATMPLAAPPSTLERSAPSPAALHDRAERNALIGMLCDRGSSTVA